MGNDPPPVRPEQPCRAAAVFAALERSRSLRVLLLLAGLVLPQVLLFGSSLSGERILLPLDILTDPGTYLPPSYPGADYPLYSYILSDLIFVGDPVRCFSADEIRAGRLPLWNPMSYAGAPFATFGKYSPFEVLYILFPIPVTLAWMQLLKGLVAGVGAYCFFRRVLGTRALPALVGAWCYPLTGFFMFWVGFNLPSVTAWLPWVLLATAEVVRRPGGWGGPVLAVFTACALLSGHLDIAAQVLLTSGLFALWELFGRAGWPLRPGRLAAAVGVLVAGWGLGFALAAPYWLPLVEYTGTSERLARRQGGEDSRPPGDFSTLAQLVVPLVYGLEADGALYVGGCYNALESAASAYTGLLATLLVVPLAWSGRRWKEAWFWLALALFGFGWQLGLPGLVDLLRLPGLGMLSHNRLVFVTSFALLVLAVFGMEAILDAAPRRRWWFALPAVLLVVVAGGCVLILIDPEPLIAVRLGGWSQLATYKPAEIEQTGTLIAAACLRGAVLCALALGGWALLTLRRRPLPWWFVPALGLGMVAELVVFAWDLNPQCPWELYYPKIPVLEKLAQAPPGRALAVRCLTACLHEKFALRDVRGYDGVDPRFIVELLDKARDPDAMKLPYAAVQHFRPAAQLPPVDRVELPALLDMLNVRYLILREQPVRVPAVLEGDGYYVVENPNVLPRAFVPSSVRAVPEESVLELLTAPGFDPRLRAYVSKPVALPAECRGQARVVEEVPTRVRLEADMETAGLLVLADNWDAGWRAYVGNRPVPVLRTNHALRGVELPAGHSTVEFRYEPRSVMIGVRVLAGGLVGLACWAAGAWWLARRRARAANPSAE